MVVGGVWGAGVFGCRRGAGGVFGVGGVGVLGGSFLGVFECCCVSVGFGIRLVLGGFRGLCAVAFLVTSNVVVVVSVSVFCVFALFCGLVGRGVGLGAW